MMDPLIHVSSIGFAALTEEGNIAYSNLAFCRMLSLSNPEAAHSISLVEYIHNRFNIPTSTLHDAFNTPSTNRIELSLALNSPRLILHIAAYGSGLRLLICDYLPKSNCNGQVKPDTFLSHFPIEFPLKNQRRLIA